MIVSFRDRDMPMLFARRSVRRFRAIERVALHKPVQLDAAATLDDTRAPPENRLEALKGDRAGWRSIRANDQQRVCFRWRDGEAHDVEIVDEH